MNLSPSGRSALEGKFHGEVGEAGGHWAPYDLDDSLARDQAWDVEETYVDRPP